MTMVAIEGLRAERFSTYRVGGPIDEAYQPDSMDDAVELLTGLDHSPLTVIGWGSNMIIASRGIRGVTLITRKMAWYDYLGDGRFVFAAGVHLANASKRVEERSLTGAEYMIGIPGTIGGAVRMNAGALGQETADVVESVTLFNRETGCVETWDHDRLAYRYRHSDLDPNFHIVLEARFRFTPGDHEAVVKAMEDSVHFRKTHHPTEPNGGSVFKNPFPKDDPESGHMSAGWMLDRLGAKQWQEGGVRVSPLHANFIVNVNNGTSTDVLKLMLRMKRAIRETYHVEVFPENLFIGDATDEERAMWSELTGGAKVGSH